MAEKNSSEEHQSTGEAGIPIQLKVLVAVMGLGILALILRAAGVF